MMFINISSFLASNEQGSRTTYPDCSHLKKKENM